MSTRFWREQQHEFHVQRINRSLQFLEKYLATRPSGFMINDSITLADLVVANAAVCAGMTVCGATEREKDYPHIFTHCIRVSSDEKVKDFFGKPDLLEKPLSVQAE